jgi:hypothetical protein
VEILSVPCGRATLIADSPEWRNWQTQQTQNLPKLCFVWVRLPPPGPFLSRKISRDSCGPRRHKHFSKECATL